MEKGKIMDYDSGEFICPNCNNKGMDKYTNWILNKAYFDKYGLKVWIFYYKIEAKSDCNCKWESIYYPLNCLFNGFENLFLCIDDVFPCVLIFPELIAMASSAFILVIIFVIFTIIYLFCILIVNIFYNLIIRPCRNLCCNKRSPNIKIEFTCLFLNYWYNLFEEITLQKVVNENIISKYVFGAIEQDIIRDGKKYFICNICKWRDESFLYFISKSTREKLDKKYITNENIEANNLQTESSLLTINQSNNTILFIKEDEIFPYFIQYKLNDTFTSIENKLYDTFPELKKRKKNNYFLCNGIRITGKTQTLRQLGIRNKDIIKIYYEEVDPIISIIFEKSQEQKSIPCNIYDLFETVEKQLYQKFPHLKNEKNYFMCNGNIITEKKKSLEELNIKNSDKILIMENYMEDDKQNNPLNDQNGNNGVITINVRNKNKINSSNEEEIISIIFKKKQQILSIPCNINESFASVENKLYHKFPILNNEKNYFVYNGIKITEKEKTLKKLNIKNSVIIEIFENENNSNGISEEQEQFISIIFIKKDLPFYFSLACNINEKFEDIENRFYKQSKFKNKDIYFMHEGYEIKDKSKTLAQLKFENSDKVIICENEIISIIFTKEDHSIIASLACNKNKKFKDIENEFYIKSEFENKKVYFTHKGNKINDKTKTLTELGFKNSDQVIVYENENNQ